MNTDQYIDIFLDESREHLQAINDNLLELEKDPKNLSIVNDIFRSAHTLKGMSATMGFEDIAALTHKMENVLDQIRNEERSATTAIVDIIFASVEALEVVVSDISNGGDGKKDVTALVSAIEGIEKGQDAVDEQVTQDHTSNSFEFDDYQLEVISQAKGQGYLALSIMVKLRDDCILKGPRAYMVMEKLESLGEVIQTMPSVEEIEDGNFDQAFSVVFVTKVSEKDVQATIENVSEIELVSISEISNVNSVTTEEAIKIEEAPSSSSQSVPSEEKQSQKSKTIRVNLDRIDTLLNLFEEVVIDRSRLQDIANKLNNQDLVSVVENMSRVTLDMQELMLSMRMLPVEQVFNRFPRMIRGLARDLGKEITLKISGKETELDRIVIEEISDPLVHLIRNSVDHGIEIPGVREEVGKSPIGTVELRAYHSGNHVFIEIEDDGAGINREKVGRKAIEKGLLQEEQAKRMTDEEIYQFIFASGFSTADVVSDISGRGVGLDVVKNKIQSLGGSIIVQSEQGKGSKFSIELPLTLSILSALLVQVQRETYAIPLSSIVETVSLSKDDLMFVHGQSVMDFRGKVIPILSLSDIFQVPVESLGTNQNYNVVVVQKGDKLTGLLVDELIGKKEVVLKSLGNFIKDVFGISGATILGDGNVALIVDPNALIQD
ncbi:chemotaxis protein CheA [Paucisalibacillus globulus]|uniref:chemotaxis protein CheA n=1 Tax=Paucisalibacillus globulus TaxID=351095 RepID=UPI000BB77499|nr:chemotaxis protein CheA [Paucisalibacillus globulus]